MIDRQGFRSNVGIILCNDVGELFWARRMGENSWQFPQGGIRPDETPEQALFRELEEEVGLTQDHVEVIGRTARWLRYRIPKRFLRQRRPRSRCIGQKQIWFLLRLVGGESNVNLDQCDKPEFDSWRWINYWETVDQVIFFKRSVYFKALEELLPLVHPDGAEKLPVRTNQS
ncbi:Adenosine (5')-pentaphospho-(5'')-adenosine pyrophosphohydrolase [hydrothermal vent metagenome]|uniref:Adenosine (5')-pentaphospho-(5'')-adenosine pyrophosphohydrolase n=1 Tax=hydrothermal vent metagenome TaxID=652676 RepID=A0A3B1ANK7_9ZZZZ